MDAVALLADLKKRGVELEPRGKKLHCRAPEGTLTPELLAVLQEHKSALLALLARSCCPGYDRRAGPPVSIVDGCDLHSISAAQVAEWWTQAEGRNAHVSYCTCCAGPAPGGSIACRRCEREGL